ncbi:MAG: TIGR01212 family radical SAM protein [Fidelibacterota bacterium]
MSTTLPFPIDHRYYRYSHYIRKKFGAKVFRIGLDCGFTCPVRDGSIATGGCLYCNNASFSAGGSDTVLSVRRQIQTRLDQTANNKKYKSGKFLAYFQSFTNTYATVDRLEKLYREALDFPEIVGLCIGTRPDCLPDDVLELLAEIAKDHYVSLELGIESIYDKTLEWVNRGHDFDTTRSGIERAAAKGLNVSGHYIFGFPTESREEMVQSAGILNPLPLTGLKIHHLHIVRNTKLADFYKREPFHLFTEEEWVLFAADFLEALRPDIVIERLVGDAMGDTLMAPVWQSPKTQILEHIRQELKERNSHQGGRVENRSI